MPPTPGPATPYSPSVPNKLLVRLFKCVNRFIPWHKLPAYVGAINLSAYRHELRQHNLYDVYPDPSYQGTLDHPRREAEFVLTRNSDGLFNALDQPKMGCAGMRFGRNVDRKWTTKPSQEELLTPNPRLVSNELLKRDTFKPATSLNLLAAAWIQFQVHDWFMHENCDAKHLVPLPDGDEWNGRSGGMEIEATLADTPLDETDNIAPAYRNKNTHWWDGSQIYGNSETRTRELRGKAVDGKLEIDSSGLGMFLPRDKDGIPVTGFVDNWWLGLEMLHTLFVLEHNAICDALAIEYPAWPSERLFDTARLVNCALMAKIHTVEWTPAILSHPTLKLGMNANWWGILGERLWKFLGRVSSSELVSGIPGSGAEQHGTPYSLTEEFVSVYRLHPLIPDDVAFFDARTGEHRRTLPISDIAFGNARKPLEEGDLKFEDTFYSFGINYPGAITLNNTPSFLRDLHTPEGRHIDLGTIDILRDRERGVPRYNQFRRLFHLPPATSFLTLTGNNGPVADKLSSVYENDIEKVDLLVGCLCEPLPKGFAFSDTAFRVFILMASRRLKSDRFIATEWGERAYSKLGLNWVQDQGMSDILLRHFPGLTEALNGVDNPFTPWRRIGKTANYKGNEY